MTYTRTARCGCWCLDAVAMLVKARHDDRDLARDAEEARIEQLLEDREYGDRFDEARAEGLAVRR